MHWRILSAFDAVQQDRFFLSNVGSRHPACVLETSGGQSWILRPTTEPDGPPLPDSLATCLLGEEDLKDPGIWKLLLHLSPVPRIRLALYSARNPEIPVEIFLHLLRSPVHYRSLSEWGELGHLDESSAQLAEEYDFPLNVLRLWNRLAQEDREHWSRLWRERGMKKNLVREIIQDLYDLSPPLREEALRRAEEFSRTWSGKSTPFPGESIRDTVRHLRSPRLEERKGALLEQKRRVSLPGGVHLEIPPDLETMRLTVQFEFDAAELFRKQMEKMLSPTVQNGVEEILKILQE